MKWLTEIRATRRSLAEIGLLTVVREVFGNSLALTSIQADETLGAGWRMLAEALRKAGMLRFSERRGVVAMSVAAPGDRKRERCRKLGRKGRAIRKFEAEDRPSARLRETAARQAVRPSGPQEVSFV